jgi:hypothetical protein
MFDAFRDEADALDERDLVGDFAAPAGLRASDATNLYLRMRLDKDPAPNGAVRPFAWGMQFDLDGNRTTYELMVITSGIAGPAGTVSIFRNTAISIPNDPADPADAPPVATFPFASNARSIVAPDSNRGGNADFFLDVAVPWSELAPLGLLHDTRTFVWAASSGVANALDGDLACHDGAGGPPNLDGTASDPTTADPAKDPIDAGGGGGGGGSGGGGGNGTGQLQGAGGCTTSGSRAPLTTFAALALVLLGTRARRRRRPRAAS